MTHNYFIAAPHRVNNRQSCERLSSTFFYSPDLDTSLAPLPIEERFLDRVWQSEHHHGAGLMASRREMLDGVDGMASKARPQIFGHKYWQRWVRSYPNIAHKHHADLEGIEG